MLAESNKNETEGQSPPPLSKAEKKKLKILQKKQEREALILKTNIGEVQKEIDTAKKIYNETGKKWKEITMKEGRPEFKDFMMEQWCLFEHLISIKDDLIKQLTEDLEMTRITHEERYNNQIELTDQLLRYFYTKVKDMSNDADLSRERLQEERDLKLTRTAQENRYMEEYMQTILYLINREKSEKDIFWSSEFVSRKDEEHHKNQNELEMKGVIYEVMIKNIFNEYQNHIQDYTKDTERKLERIKVTQKRVELEEKIIHDHIRILYELNGSIEKGKEIVRRGEPNRSQLEALRHEKNNLSQLYRDTKHHLSIYQQNYEEHLKYFVGSSNDAIKYLTAVLKMGEKIMKLHNLCRPYETEDEQRHMKRFHFVTASVTHKMGKFWRRVAAAESLKTYMEVRRKSLKKKNSSLKAYLKRVLVSENLSLISKDLMRCEQNH